MRRWIVPAMIGVFALLAATPAASAGTASERIAKQRESIRTKIAQQHHEAGIGDHHARPAAPQARSSRAAAPAPERAAPAPEKKAAAPKAAERGPTAPRSSGKVIEVLIGSQTLRAWQDGKLVMSTPVSTGRPGFETPRGEFSIKSKERSHWSTQYHVHMPYAMRVVRGIFIHELPISPEGQRLGTTKLGHPVSGGCIRVGIGSAKRLYDWASIGTPVLIR